MHLWTSGAALYGQRAYARRVAAIDALPGLLAFEIAFLGLPLVYHALYGVVLTFAARPGTLIEPYKYKWLSTLQRITGIISLFFIGFHLWEFRLQKAWFGMPSSFFYTRLTANLSSTWHGMPVVALGYLLGVLATVFHFANGVSAFAVTWGIVSRPLAQMRMRMLAATLGVLLSILATATVVGLATGSQFGNV